MANFELRIYVIDIFTYERVKEENLKATEELDDETFIELCEEQGGVYSLNGFLSKETHDTIDLTENVFRAYFVEVDNGNSAPIRADHYYTVISANKISYDFGNKGNEQVLYLELNKPFGKSTVEEEPISRTYTVVLTNHDEENDLTGVIADIQDKDYVQDVELLEEYENKVRIQVEVDSDIDFDKLCTDLEDWLGVTADLINEVENY